MTTSKNSRPEAPSSDLHYWDVDAVAAAFPELEAKRKTSGEWIHEVKCPFDTHTKHPRAAHIKTNHSKGGVSFNCFAGCGGANLQRIVEVVAKRTDDGGWLDELERRSNGRWLRPRRLDGAPPSTHDDYESDSRTTSSGAPSAASNGVGDLHADGSYEPPNDFAAYVPPDDYDSYTPPDETLASGSPNGERDDVDRVDGEAVDASGNESAPHNNVESDTPSAADVEPQADAHTDDASDAAPASTAQPTADASNAASDIERDDDWEEHTPDDEAPPLDEPHYDHDADVLPPEDYRPDDDANVEPPAGFDDAKQPASPPEDEINRDRVITDANPPPLTEEQMRELEGTVVHEGHPDYEQLADARAQWLMKCGLPSDDDEFTPSDESGDGCAYYLSQDEIIDYINSEDFRLLPDLATRYSPAAETRVPCLRLRSRHHQQRNVYVGWQDQFASDAPHHDAAMEKRSNKLSGWVKDTPTISAPVWGMEQFIDRTPEVVLLCEGNTDYMTASLMLHAAQRYGELEGWVAVGCAGAEIMHIGAERIADACLAEGKSKLPLLVVAGDADTAGEAGAIKAGIRWELLGGRTRLLRWRKKQDLRDVWVPADKNGRLKQRSSWDAADVERRSETIRWLHVVAQGARERDALPSCWVAYLNDESISSGLQMLTAALDAERRHNASDETDTARRFEDYRRMLDRIFGTEENPLPFDKHKRLVKIRKDAEETFNVDPITWLVLCLIYVSSLIPPEWVLGAVGANNAPSSCYLFLCSPSGGGKSNALHSVEGYIRPEKPTRETLSMFDLRDVDPHKKNALYQMQRTRRAVRLGKPASGTGMTLPLVADGVSNIRTKGTVFLTRGLLIWKEASEFIEDRKNNYAAQVRGNMLELWVGEEVSRLTADLSRNREVPPQTVNVSAIIAGQDHLAAELVVGDDREVGFTQRLLFHRVDHHGDINTIYQESLELVEATRKRQIYNIAIQDVRTRDKRDDARLDVRLPKLPRTWTQAWHDAANSLRTRPDDDGEEVSTPAGYDGQLDLLTSPLTSDDVEIASYECPTWALDYDLQTFFTVAQKEQGAKVPIDDRKALTREIGAALYAYFDEDETPPTTHEPEDGPWHATRNIHALLRALKLCPSAWILLDHPSSITDPNNVYPDGQPEITSELFEWITLLSSVAFTPTERKIERRARIIAEERRAARMREASDISFAQVMGAQTARMTKDQKADYRKAQIAPIVLAIWNDLYRNQSSRATGPAIYKCFNAKDKHGRRPNDAHSNWLKRHYALAFPGISKGWAFGLFLNEMVDNGDLPPQALVALDTMPLPVDDEQLVMMLRDTLQGA